MTKTLLLAGNGTFQNRGCEAISRGTIEILRQAFGSSLRIIDASQGITNGKSGEPDIQSVPFFPGFRKYSKAWGAYQLNRFFGTSFTGGFNHLQQVLSQVDVILCIGGDNYSLDYGYPEVYVQFDRMVLSLKKPIAYFGVSVGPFSSDARYERKMKSHLSRIDAIFARETATVSYLSSIGVAGNVHLIADPAFVMREERPDPAKFVLERSNFIGINFSTTVGRWITERDQEYCHAGKNCSFTSNGNSKDISSIIRHYADITACLMDRYGDNLVFIPHVTGGAHCDHVFLSSIADHLETMGYQRPLVVPDTLTAPEYKWIIARSRLFIGARTHSTIASFSSGVPTVTLAYSMKARGLTQDMYGCDDFCIDGRQVSAKRLLAATERLLDGEESYRGMLKSKAREMAEKAYSAGNVVKQMALLLFFFVLVRSNAAMDYFLDYGLC